MCQKTWKVFLLNEIRYQIKENLQKEVKPIDEERIKNIKVASLIVGVEFPKWMCRRQFTKQWKSVFKEESFPSNNGSAVVKSVNCRRTSGFSPVPYVCQRWLHPYLLYKHTWHVLPVLEFLYYVLTYKSFLLLIFNAYIKIKYDRNIPKTKYFFLVKQKKSLQHYTGSLNFVHRKMWAK